MRSEWTPDAREYQPDIIYLLFQNKRCDNEDAMVDGGRCDEEIE